MPPKIPQRPGPLVATIKKYKFFREGNKEAYENSYAKQAMAEIPDALAAFSFFLLSLPIFYTMWRRDVTTEYYSNRPHKCYYTVVRPDDYAVKRLVTKNPLQDEHELTIRSFQRQNGPADGEKYNFKVVPFKVEPSTETSSQ